MPEDVVDGPALTVVVSRDGTTVTMSFSGELDISTLGRVERALIPVEPGGRLVLDLRRLRFMDSTGIRLLMQLDLRARGEGWRLAIVRAPGAVDDLLRLTRMHDRVPLVDDPADLR